MPSIKKMFLPALCAAAMSFAATGAFAAWDGPNAWDEPTPWEPDYTRPAVSQTCQTSPVEKTTLTIPEPKPQTPPPATTTVTTPAAIGAPDLLSLGQALCASGLNADIDALLALIEPVSFNMMIEMMGAFASDVESGMNPIEMFKAEFQEEMRNNPLVSCIVADTQTTECVPEQLADLSTLGMPSPEACGAITMRSKQADDESTKDDTVNAVKVQGQWYIVFF